MPGLSIRSPSSRSELRLRSSALQYHAPCQYAASHGAQAASRDCTTRYEAAHCVRRPRAYLVLRARTQEYTDTLKRLLVPCTLCHYRALHSARVARYLAQLAVLQFKAGEQRETLQSLVVV
eukprot:802064-Rhodomonas_salina.3